MAAITNAPPQIAAEHLPAVPLTLEGASMLHQMLRVRWTTWKQLAHAERAEIAEPEGSDAALLLEGIVLRLQADLRWLEACEANWTTRRMRHR